MVLLEIDTTAIIVSLIGTLGTIIIAISTILLNKRIKDYHTEVNGKMEQLLEAKKDQGRLEEKEKAEPKTDALHKEIVDAVKQIPTENKPSATTTPVDKPTEVIVANKEPIDVKHVPPDKP